MIGKGENRRTEEGAFYVFLRVANVCRLVFLYISNNKNVRMLDNVAASLIFPKSSSFAFTSIVLVY